MASPRPRAGSIQRDRSTKVGYDYVHSLVDDHSRLAYSEILPGEKGVSCAAFLRRAIDYFAAHGIARIERLMTDNAWAYTKATYPAAVEAIGARHKRTRPHRPQTNGKAERFIKTLLHEWAYGRPYRSNAERLERLPVWVDEYNTGRTHTSLGGITPMEALVNNLRGDHT